MPTSLAQLDLLLLTIPKTRIVQQDGISFAGFRYIDPTLAAYVGEQVVLRYDPRDIAELRVFHRGKFICRAICQELAGKTIPLREITKARKNRLRQLRETIQDRERAVESLLEARRWSPPEPPPPADEAPTSKKTSRGLKRYRSE
jgi:putative transposase